MEMRASDMEIILAESARMLLSR